MIGKKLVWGVCGIGNGHLYRQLPLIEHFAKGNRIAIFSSGSAYAFLRERFAGVEAVRVIEALVPFYPGTKEGVDWGAVDGLPQNIGKDFVASKFAALRAAEEFIGVPDLVLSDYEPTAAAYAYAHHARLVTIDQQSKYLAGDFQLELGGFSFQDEVERLQFFFPTATERMVCSFFRFPLRANGERVTSLPPILKTSIADAHSERVRDQNSFVVYVSAARAFPQSPIEVVKVLQGFSNSVFHLFVPAAELNDYMLVTSNIHVHAHGDLVFEPLLIRASGVITTAGHSLLSEAMHLALPVYAIPVAPYEQHMNAKIIAENGFGVSSPVIEQKNLKNFIENNSHFRQAIETDTKVLCKGSGLTEIIGKIEKLSQLTTL